MKALLFKDARVELSTPDDCFLTKTTQLVLEASSKDNVVHHVNLMSRKSRPGTWSANQMLIVPEVFEDFRISVSRVIGETGSQLLGFIVLGFIEMNGSGLYAELGKKLEINLKCHEEYRSLVLKARLWGFDYIQEQVLGIDDRERTFQMLQASANRSLDDYQSQENLEGLNQAIVQLQQASGMVDEDDSRLPSILNNLGTAFFRRFLRLGDITDIDNSITLHERAINLFPDHDPDKLACLNNLSTSLAFQAERLGNHADIEDAIRLKRVIVDLTPDSHPHKPMYLNNLGFALHTRFVQLGNVADINDAIVSLKKAIDLAPDDHREKAMFLCSLGMSLQLRFERLGNPRDIDDAIVSNQAAVELTPDGHFEKSLRLSNAGMSFHRRFKRIGNIADIDNAIALNQAAVNAIPNDHPLKFMHLSNVSVSFQTRFKYLGIPDDINSAIASIQAAVDLAPDDHPQKAGLLNNLGVSLQYRFKLLGNFRDIDRAIISNQAARDLASDHHPEKALFLSNLGRSLNIRYDKFERLEDLDDAIRSDQMAVHLTLDDHPSKPLFLHNLGQSLLARFERLNNSADIDGAIASIQTAVDVMPNGHPDMLTLLISLGMAFRSRFFHLKNPTDAQKAIFNLSAAVAAPVGPPIDRFRAAEVWSSVAYDARHPSLLTACEHVIKTMPLVAWLGLPIADRHQHLVEMGSITREVVAIAISLGQYDKALEWLEQGRSIVWTQILQLRTPVDQLRDVNLELAESLIRISRILDQGQEKNGTSSGEMQSAEEKGRQHRSLTIERETILQQIRALPDFEDFLGSPNALKLTKVAQDGPVIVLNVAKRRCDALALIPGLEAVIYIPLPNITPERVMDLGNQLKDILFSMNIRERGDRAAMKLSDDDIDDEGVCKQVLAELWDGVVKPVLDSLKFYPHPDTLPRIWWCPTGPFAFLPIHAAGIYKSGSVDSQLSDYVISSYIPTLSTLLNQPNRSAGASFKLLSVIQPSTPGASSIPNTKEELECIRRRVPDRNHDILDGPEGTKGRVIKGMEDCSWIHLACHGMQKPGEPTKSALLLEDGHLTLEEITKLDLPKAQLAFLSACQTTTGDEKLSEEAVHIAGGMLLAGYRGVVATMWSIQDDLAPEVADEFYAHLIQDGQEPDSRKAAEALHISVQKLRQKRNVPLIAWIPFVHLGI